MAQIARCVAAFTIIAQPAQAQVRDSFAARLELGAGAMASAFQRNEDPAAFNGEAKGFGLALHGALRLAWSIIDGFALQASISNWVFPARAGAETGWVFAPMLGVRFEPTIATAGRAFFDGNLGIAMTGDERTLQIDLGAGFEFRLTPTSSLGPMVRYGQTVQPDVGRDGRPGAFPDDARYVVGGLSFSLHTTPVAATTTPPPAVTHRDREHVSHTVDLCPSETPGERPDGLRPGCTSRHGDTEGVPDERDVRVEVAQGPAADPMPAGSPDAVADVGLANHDDARPEADSDGDGYTDSQDRCPAAAETFNNLTDGDGCPESVGPTVEIRSGMIALLGNPVTFLTGSDRIIGRRSFEVLDALVAVLRAHAAITRVDIQGHTDDRGERATNLDLSASRARAVRMYLIDHGILPDRVEAHGFGPDRPIVENDRPERRAANRRVEVHIHSARSRDTQPP